MKNIVVLNSVIIVPGERCAFCQMWGFVGHGFVRSWQATLSERIVIHSSWASRELESSVDKMSLTRRQARAKQLSFLSLTLVIKLQLGERVRRVRCTGSSIDQDRNSIH